MLNVNRYLTIAFPLRGVWQSINSPGHDRFALGLVALNPGTGRRLTKSTWAHLTGHVSAQDFYSWSQPVHSPVDGSVVAASDDWPDRKDLNLLRDFLSMFLSRPELTPDDIRPFAGNYLIIRSGPNYVFMAHLKQGSLTVSEGRHLATGQLIGEVGDSGFALEPHLHLQLMDQVDNLVTSKAVPFRFQTFEQWDGENWRLKENAFLEKSVRIRNASIRSILRSDIRG